MKRVAFLCCLLVTLFVVGPARAAWFALSEPEPAPPAVALEQLAPDQLVIHVTMSGFDASEPEDGYVRLAIPEGSVAGAYGQPELPTVTELLRVPFGAKLAVSTEAVYDEMPVSTLIGAPRIMPAQPSVPKLPGAREAAVFTIDEQSYHRAAPIFDAPAGVVGEGQLRGYRFVALQMRPFNYRPADGTLSLARELTVRVRFLNSDWTETAYQDSRYAEPRTFAMARELMINFDAFPRGKAEAFAPSAFVLIGDAAVFQNAKLQEFIEWETQRGYDVKPVTLNEVGGPDAMSILNFLRNAYETWEIPPAYVLLLGDTNIIPAFDSVTGSMPTDVYYGAMNEQDYFPDLGIGRLPFRKDGQLNNMLNKIMSVEKNQWTGGDGWTRHATFMASNDNFNISQGTHNYVCAEDLKPAGFTCTKVYTHQGGTTQEAIAALNTGPTVHAYSGHGSETSWADGPVMNQNQVRNLTNQTFPLVLSHACVTGSYDIPECFGETFVRIATGALAFWGASNNSYWDEDDVIERAMFDGWFKGDGKLATLPWTKGMLDYSLIKLYEQYNGGGRTRYYFEMYNLFGNPETQLYSAPPATLDPQYDEQLPFGTTTFTVNVPGHAGAMVGVTEEGELLGVGYVGDNGAAAIELSRQPAGGEELTLTITGQNAAPYIGSIAIVTPGDDDDDSGDDDNDSGGDDDLIGDDDDNGGDDDDDSGGCGG
jgi:hypothetical protein